MPAVVPGPAGHLAPVGTQARHARETVVVRLFHLAEPWACWLALLAVAALVRGLFPGALPGTLVIAGGLALAVLDHHLRAYRSTVVGRMIGPVSIACCCGWLAAVVLAGWSREILEAWLIGGLAGCLSWDAWLAHGDHHDRARAYVPAAETALGVPGSRLTGVRKRGNVTTAVMQHPPGVVTGEAAARLENLESALGDAPGSWVLTSDRADAGLAGVVITDPQLLDRAPIPWPGPSAPGESVAVPFREGMWADGEPFLYSVLPGHHVRGMGATGSGKTVSWAYNHIAEGITRHDYACLAADITKGGQFLGPLSPALHRLAVTPDQAVSLLGGIHRVVRARCDYLFRQGLFEWKPGCGLTYLDILLEETPDIIALLEKAALRDWISDVRAGRSAGVLWRQSYQRSDHTQLPTIARGQMGHLCFGVMEKKDAEFGLSELQRERGCRPQLWGAAYPGKAYIDTLTVPEERKTMPLRFFSWGEDASRVTAYASEFPASRRQLDEVTGEALEAAPGRLASSAFPAPRRRVNGGGRTARPAALRPRARPHRIDPDEAARRLDGLLGAWRAEGRVSFIAREVVSALGEEVVCTGCGRDECPGRTRGWLYARLAERAGRGELSVDGSGRPARFAFCRDLEGDQAW